MNKKKGYMSPKKRTYKIKFTSGKQLVAFLNQFELKRLIHNYKVVGYKAI